MAVPTPVYANSFHLALSEFKTKLTNHEKSHFQVTTLQDLHVAIETIQRKHASEKRLRGMQRLEVFLEGMKEYDKVIQVFVNSTPLLAFIWGPMKLVLQAACTFSEAFDVLIDAYQRIGELIPLLSQYECVFRNHPQMSRVLSLIYEDLLEFHWKTMRYFKQRMWKKLFHALWKSFNAEFATILKNLRAHKELIESQATLAQFKELISNQELAKTNLERSKEIELHRRREVVYQWLSAPQCEVDQETYAKVRQEYPWAGRWLLKLDRFQSWFDPDFCSTPLLWLSGIPGAGKTILASLVIEEARKIAGISIAFFYCRYQDQERNNFVAVVRGLLAQLLTQDPALLAYIYEKASRSGQTTLSTRTLAKELIGTALKSFPKLYIILDGIDECEREERKEITSTLETTWESLPADNLDPDSLRCLFISQDDGPARKDFAKMVPLKISEGEVKKDIRAYVRTWSSKMQVKFMFLEDERKRIEDLITRNSDGMFLFARLMSSYLYDLESRRRLEEETSPGHFPQGPLKLDEIYQKIILRMFGQGGLMKDNPAARLLGWLVCAKRSLKWREIQCAVAVNVDHGSVDWERGIFRSDSKDLCGSLVEVHTDDTVNLVHHTAKRYFMDKKIVDLAAVELDLALLCIGYLSLPDFDTELEPPQIRHGLVRGVYSFFDYAYGYWGRHIERSVVTLKSNESLHEIAEAVGVFIDMHWTEPQIQVSPPKLIKETLKALKSLTDFERVVGAVHLSRKQLIPTCKILPEEQVLGLGLMISRVRQELEELPEADRNSDTFRQKHGTDIFKCPRPNCTRFYNGFSTRTLRDDHISKHERSYFCFFPTCPFATVGCPTAKELQKHETDAHGTFDFDEDIEFPEELAEKITFTCPQCDAKFTRNHNLKIHMRAHNAPNEKKFVCTTCGKGFARLGDRTRHQSTFHSGPKSFTCGGRLKSGEDWGCGQSFNRADILSRHFKSEKGRNCRLPLEEEEASSVSTPTMEPSSS